MLGLFPLAPAPWMEEELKTFQQSPGGRGGRGEGVQVTVRPSLPSSREGKGCIPGVTPRDQDAPGN
jgi:hypothetical protein